MPAICDFPNVITAVDDLEAVYGPPADAVQQKCIDQLDDHRLIIPDAAGNKTTDVLHRIVNGGSVGLLFVIPGRNETLRVRGQACVTRDAELLEGLQTGGKPAVLGIDVIVETAFQHCAKAFMRSGLWQPDQWPARDALPKPARVWTDHIALNEVDEALVEAFATDDYEHNL